MTMKNRITHLMLFALMILGGNLFGQHEELKQRVEAFIADHKENYEKKFLNISDPKIGDIENTEHDFAERFMLKGKASITDNLDREVREEIYVNIYAYPDDNYRDYALKYWFDNFIEGGSIRPGRDTKKLQYATPTIIIINKDNVCILNYKCSLFFEDSFRVWRKKMLQYFGDEMSTIIEIGCDGPVQWTKNPPDPKDRRWR